METVDLVKQVVDNIDNTFIAKTIVDEGDGTYTLTTCDTLHLQPKFSVVINAITFKVVSVIEDVSVVLSGPSLPALSTFDIYLPIYFHGTVIKAKYEIENKSRNIFENTPFIYLKEIIKDVNMGENGSPLDRETDVKIFFLTQSDLAKWTTIDHYSYSIKPMNNLVKRFIASYKKEPLLARLQDYDTTNHVNFGTYVDAKGHIQSIWIDRLSGVELDITLPIRKAPCLNCN